MNWTLEVVVVPVSDIERAKSFYAEQLGFNLDHDVKMSDELRVVQLTPPGSGCSVVIGEGVAGNMKPGSIQGLQLVVNDLYKAHAQLVDAGVPAGEVMFASPTGFRPAQEGDDLNNNGFVFFSDPDGNGWTVQQITDRG